ncbi:MAG: hypothetical protein K9K38_17755 [Rhodoferax sp.]|nr:hypothetical protein [Rhodoferax sp.]
MKYSKPALSNADLLARWQAKGLAIPQLADAERALLFIGYFRLRGYVVMRLFSRALDTQDEWPVRLMDLFKTHPAMAPSDLGFPPGWEADPLWN